MHRKMVNVLSAVPFNIRNDSLSPHVRGSSSRSDRGSPVHHAYSNSKRNHLGTDKRRPSHQISATTSRSTSTTSLVQNSGSGASQGLDVHESEPILNLRIVRPSDTGEEVVSRGRPRARSGKGIDIVSLDQDESSPVEDLAVDHGVGVSRMNGIDSLAALESHAAVGLDDCINSSMMIWLLFSFSQADPEHSQEVGSSFSSPKSFTIEDVGSISRGWND